MSHLSDTPAKALKEQYGLEVFVETGCGNGDGLRYAKEIGFEKRLSCDTNFDSVIACRSLGETFWMPSDEFLVFVAGDAHQALFWLDAHFGQFFGAGSDSKAPFPLLDELQVIRQYKKGLERDVIICDDIRCIQSDDNPLREPGGGHDWEEVHGLTIAQLTEPFADTHTWRLEKTISGILVFTPK